MPDPEYIEKRQVNMVLTEARKRYPSSFYNGLEAARALIMNMPASDAVIVTRCQYCIYKSVCADAKQYGDNHYCSLGKFGREEQK